MDVYTVEMKT